MDLIADRGRRVTVEELNTSRLLAHARKQAVQRKFDDMLIVDVDAHHYENEHFGEILPFMENDVLRQLAMSAAAPRAAAAASSPCRRRLPGHGRPRDALSAARHREDRRTARIRDVAARPSLDGRDERRLLLPVPDRHAHRSACIRRRRWRSSCAGPTTAGSPRRCCRNPSGRFFSMLCLPFSDPDACAAPGREVRRPQARRRLHGHDRAQQPRGQRQPLHEGLSRHRGARPGAVVPLRPELGRADLQELQPLPHRRTRSASPGTTSSTVPTGSSTAWASASPSCR